MSAAAFKAGDRVAWHHAFATQHAAGSIIRAEAVPQGNLSDPGTGQLGTIDAAVDDSNGFLWEVTLDGEKTSRVLTADELVKVAEEEPS